MDITKIRDLILTEETTGGKKLTAYHDTKISTGHKPAGYLRNDATGVSAHTYTVGKGKKQHHVTAYVKHGHVYKESPFTQGSPNYGAIKASLMKESACDNSTTDITGPIDPASANAELLRKKMAAIGETLSNDEDTDLLRKEALPADATASDYIRDFIKSKASTFSGDTKKQRIRRALGAYYGQQKKGKEEDLQVLKQGDDDDNIQEGLLSSLFGSRVPLIGHKRHTHHVQYVMTSSTGKSLRGGKTHNAHVIAPDNQTAVDHLASYLGHNNFKVTRIDHVRESRTRVHKEEIEPSGNLLKELPKKKKKKKETSEEKIKLSGRKDIIDTEPTLNTLTATR